MSPPLVFVTANSWAPEETARLLSGLHVTFARLGLPKGPGSALEDVATFRARAAFGELQRPCFVENTSLQLEGDAPMSGASFKKEFRALGDEGFCQRYAGRRGATRVVVALATSDGSVQLFTGSGEGAVAATPRGTGGYGWDRVWIPDGYTRTVAELGDSKFLINMRERPFLELAAHVRGEGTPGYFEAHVTVRPCELTAFAASCAKWGVKCLHIVMPEGTAQAEQPMTGSYHLGTLPQVQEQVLSLARDLVRDGFEVTRVKIEATGRAFGAPEDDAAAAALPMETYFEHHATVLLPEGFDEAVLIERCRGQGGYVSRNLRKPAPERFVTLRSYRVGRLTADARFEKVLDEVRTLGVPLKNRAREFTVHDSAPQIDAGWMNWSGASPGDATST
ncbi:MAG: non-canonical purine NTP pyrophosphatase [Archangium sp.]|nr:non-canonical purine NTP pyrophosphatase [Archangium sp.]